MIRGIVALLSALAVAACGGTGGGAPAPPPLAFTLPAEPSVVYVRGDTATVDVDAGGQTFSVESQAHAEWGMEFIATEGGVEVTASLRDYAARLTTPVAPAQFASVDQVDGPLVFTLDRRGVSTLVSAPVLTGAASEFVTPELLAATLFPRLPGRSITAGESWTDTVVVEAQTQAGAVTSTSVLTYTAVGDTVIAGRSLLLVRFSGSSEQAMRGMMGGFDMSQDLSGTSEGRFAWDRHRSLLYSSASRSDMTGTLEVSAAPLPLSVRIRSLARTLLQVP